MIYLYIYNIIYIIYKDYIFNSGPEYSEKLLFNGNVVFVKFFVIDVAFKE